MGRLPLGAGPGAEQVGCTRGYTHLGPPGRVLAKRRKREGDRERKVCPEEGLQQRHAEGPLPGLAQSSRAQDPGLWALTLSDVTQTLGVQQVPQPGDLVLEFTDEFVVGVFIDDSVTANLLGPVSIPKWART